MLVLICKNVAMGLVNFKQEKYKFRNLSQQFMNSNFHAINLRMSRFRQRYMYVLQVPICLLTNVEQVLPRNKSELWQGHFF